MFVQRVTWALSLLPDGGELISSEKTGGVGSVSALCVNTRWSSAYTESTGLMQVLKQTGGDLITLVSKQQGGGVLI